MNINTHWRWYAAACGTLALAMLRAADVVQFTVRTTDDAGQPLPARVLVRDEQGQAWLPPVATTVNIGPDTWFAGAGHARLDVPAGRYLVVVERGPEYQPARASVVLTGNTTREFRLQRWIDLAARGYRSGENHLHVTGSMLPAMMAAEALDFSTSLQWWNGPQWDAAYAAAAGAYTRFDAEIENSWGAVYCLGLTRPLPVAWNPARPNLAFVRAARADGALICYQGGWSAEVLLDALLGYVDVVNVADNLFQRHKFMPRSRYSNLLGTADLPVYPDTADGMLALTTESYYRLLNCGLRLAAGAGSATGVKSNPVGHNRAYVQVPPGAGIREFLAAWREGRNFITNGPMVFLSVNGAAPGATVDLPAGGGKLAVHVEAPSADPLREVRIVVNGQVVAAGGNGSLDTTIDVREGSWVCAMAVAEEPVPEADLARYAQTSRLGGERPARLRFAHTSPVYVTVAGQAVRVARSVAEAQRILDALAAFVQQTAAPEFQAETAEAIAAARTRLAQGGPFTAEWAPAAPSANSATIPAAMKPMPTEMLDR
ncbi:CehA/McbA family metallohydrolase [Opitutus sp. ER46]|uniref:CehA/McbA family metallohydrolase n=1 Tax=Opitutus sp. ER46 TaxID=2161864 RepID=UPI000D3075CD|nr:CehA/McbA family metallohydrolase [Opitutus sp. ER46]PTX94617.1 hypothetical protein DB354_12870 [Opitutus sp. ER46]